MSVTGWVEDHGLPERQGHGKNVQAQAENFLNFFGIRYPPTPFPEKRQNSRREVPPKIWNKATSPSFLKKCPNMNRTKKFFEKFGFRHDPPPLEKFQTEADFFFTWLPIVQT